jgi:hypothetical protein
LARLQTGGELAEGIETVVQAVAEGHLSPAAGEAIARIMEIQRNAIETRELAARIEELEENKREREGSMILESESSHSS